MAPVSTQAVRQQVRSWGRLPSGDCDVAHLDTSLVPAEIRSAGPRGSLGRGAGRSYGDAALNGGGELLQLGEGCSLDLPNGRVTALAGTTFETLLRACLPHGWTLPVLPGTRYLTLGGAVAADVHGKNHVADGSLGSWVEQVQLVDGNGQDRRLVPDQPEFWATLGGMGLTGVITSATVRLVPVTSSAMTVHQCRQPDLDAVLAALDEGALRSRWAVAWVDGLASGSAFGRGVLSTASSTPAEEAGPDPLGYAPGAAVSAPPVPTSLVTRASARAFNELWWRRAARPRTDTVPLTAFFHPLDGLRGWNRCYGPRGFLQYQFVVPDSGVQVVGQALAGIAAGGGAPFLGVLKRFGEANPGPLSFPRPGWSLAVDLPHTAGLARVLDGLDELVALAGGAVYLAKDARLRPCYLPTMYPRIGQWRQLRDQMDPQHRFQSDLDRRLGLSADA